MPNRDENIEDIGLPFKVECPEALRNVYYDGGLVPRFSLDEIDQDDEEYDQ